jgi:hypothetical protein
LIRDEIASQPFACVANNASSCAGARKYALRRMTVQLILHRIGMGSINSVDVPASRIGSIDESKEEESFLARLEDRVRHGPQIT